MRISMGISTVIADSRYPFATFIHPSPFSSYSHRRSSHACTSLFRNTPDNSSSSRRSICSLCDTGENGQWDSRYLSVSWLQTKNEKRKEREMHSLCGLIANRRREKKGMYWLWAWQQQQIQTFPSWVVVVESEVARLAAFKGTSRGKLCNQQHIIFLLQQQQP
jgi:hypothetical protein